MKEEKQLQELWNSVLSVLQTELSPATFKTIFKETALLSLNENVATIAAPSSIMISMIRQRFSQTIKKALEKHAGEKIEIEFVSKTIQREKTPRDIGPLFTEEKKTKTPSFSLARVRPDYTFENMAVSSSNQLAFVSATTVAKNPGKSYNPLFIYGPVGVGKTHLMHAIANELYQKDPTKKIIYQTSEEFTNDVVNAIRANQTQNMKKKYRSANLLIIDDIQFLAGKDKVQEELFHTFNILIDNASQIVLSSDRPPNEIKKLEKRLSSRFSGGLTVDVETPDFELRTAILLIKAKKIGMELSIETAKIIAQNTQDARLLEGTLLRVITEANTENKDISEIISKKINGGVEGFQKGRIHFEDIIKNVCFYYNIKPTQLKGPRRTSSLARARQICMYILQKELGMTLVEIGNVLGGRDHTTVMHGVGKIELLFGSEKGIQDEIMGITTLLRE